METTGLWWCMTLRCNYHSIYLFRPLIKLFVGEWLYLNQQIDVYLCPVTSYHQIKVVVDQLCLRPLGYRSQTSIWDLFVLSSTDNTARGRKESVKRYLEGECAHTCACVTHRAHWVMHKWPQETVNQSPVQDMEGKGSLEVSLSRMQEEFHRPQIRTENVKPKLKYMDKLTLSCSQPYYRTSFFSFSHCWDKQN